MRWIELTVNNVQKPRVLFNCDQIVRIEAHPHTSGSLVFTTPKADGSPTIHVIEDYAQIRAKLTSGG